MVRILLIAAALVAALEGTSAASQKPDSAPSAPPAPAVKAGDPSGVYLCEGTNPDGHRYRGIVQIAAVRNTYLVRWTLADDVEVMGVGILHDGQLSVSYFGGTPAVVVYKIAADKLVGEWTMGGTEGRVYAETLTRVPEGSLPKPQPQQPRQPRPRRSEPIPGSITL
jgi:hypothetical protein